MKLTHTQAYLLGSIAKHSDNYRRALTSLSSSVREGLDHGPRRGINLDAATKAHYASNVIDELLDQLYEEFADLPGDTISTFVNLAIQPTDKGFRRRFNVDEEF